jgi:hypothetical protein
MSEIRSTRSRLPAVAVLAYSHRSFNRACLVPDNSEYTNVPAAIADSFLSPLIQLKRQLPVRIFIRLCQSLLVSRT